MDFRLLFVCLFGICFHSRAVPLSSSTNLVDLDRQLADEADKIKRNVPSTEDFLLQKNGKSDDNIDSEERTKRGVEALQNEDQQFDKRDTDEGDYEDDSDDSFDGRDKRGSENMDDSDNDQDEPDEDEILERARRNSENTDKVQDDEYSNNEKRAVGDDAEEDDDDQDDLNDIEKRDIYDDLDEDDDDEEEEEDFVKKRRKRSAQTTKATPSASPKKDVKTSKNGTCKSQRSVTLSDLDKLLSAADDDDDDEDDNTQESESKNKRNMEEFFDEDKDDDYDDDGDEKAEVLSRHRRDVDDEDDEDDDDSEDLSRQARDLEDEDDDDDDDDDEEEEDERKRRETDVDDEDDDDEEDDSDFNKIVRMLRDTTGDKKKQDDDEDDDDDFGEKIQSVATRDLSTSNVNEDATENQPNSYEASNDNPAQNVDKREADYDYDEEDLNSNIGQQLEKRDEGSDQPINEENEDFSEKDIDKTRTKPFFTNLVIDEPDDFSINEQGDNPSVTINNAGMKTRNQRPSRGHNKLNLIKVNKHSLIDSDTKKPSYSTTIYNEKKPVYHNNGKYKSDLKHQKRRLKILHSNTNYNDNSIMSKDEKTRRESSDVNIPDNAGEPRGPIAKENKLNKVFAGMFVQNPKADIQWVEPDMLANCWVHAMLAHSFGNGFSPSCSKDGTYSAKQCFLQRCWCVNRDGSPQDPYFDTRFFYAVKGAMHSCIQVN